MTNATKFHQAIATALGCPVELLSEVSINLNEIRQRLGGATLFMNAEDTSMINMFEEIRRLTWNAYPHDDQTIQFVDDAGEFEGCLCGAIVFKGVKMVFTWESEDNAIQRIWTASEAPGMIINYETIKADPILSEKFLKAHWNDITDATITEQIDSNRDKYTVVRFKLNEELFKVKFPVILNADVRYSSGREEMLYRICFAISPILAERPINDRPAARFLLKENAGGNGNMMDVEDTAQNITFTVGLCDLQGARQAIKIFFSLVSVPNVSILLS